MTSTTTYMVRLSDGQEFGPADMDTLVEWARQRRVPMDALLVATQGGAIHSVLSAPRLAAVLQAPPTSPTGEVHQTSSKITSSALIPAGNPCALTGYYVAVFSLIPGLVILSPVALTLGVIGLVKRIKKPEVRGMAHALVAIILGLMVPAAYALFIFVVANM